MQNKYILYVLFLGLLISCVDSNRAIKVIDSKPDITPDYADVTIPINIAPLNFYINTPCDDARAFLSSSNYEIKVREKKGQFFISTRKWKQLLESADGQSIDVVVQLKNQGEWVEYAPFKINVKEAIDPYIAYRLIEPGYTLWNKMGIYQRNLENYKESAIIENDLTKGNCINCHSFCMQDPDKMLFHMRKTYPCTILIKDGKIEKLNTKTDQTISPLVYPSWHPSGKFVAFSTNETFQNFHTNDANRIEVYDRRSDVVVYDVERSEIVTSSKLFSPESFETFPTFSPDGKTLYFCTADSLSVPEEYSKVKYHLCSIGFDPDTRSFGTVVDTLYNANISDKSVSFPRVSPDGKHLIYTLSEYGNFSIWHKDADLYMIDLTTRKNIPLEIINSNSAESYHSWSSNSRWLIFSSRRQDGLYTHPYIAYIDENGKADKPFILPQKDADFYDKFMMSYNIPEFITGKVNVRSQKIASKAKNDKGINVKSKF